MARIITLLFISLLLQLQITAQNIIEYNKGSFYFKSPISSLPLYTPSNKSGDTTHCIAYVLEFGNGYFSINPSNAFPYKYTYNPFNPNCTSVLSFFPRYDTIKPPAVVQYKITPGVLSGFAQVNPEILSSSENIRVTSLPETIRPDEESIFIITYKIPDTISKGIILFYYNEGNFQVFDSVNEQSVTSNANVKSIRTGYFGETINTELANNALSQQSTTAGKMQGRDYRNVIAFDVTNRTNGEQNIFITLKSKENLPQAVTGFFEAVFIPTEDNIVNNKPGNAVPNLDTLNIIPPENEGSLDNIMVVSSVEMTASLYPHDPNFIEVVPKCFQKDTSTTKVHYHVHCQNDGAGKNYELSVIINMDPKLLAGIKTSSLKVNSAGIKVEPNHFSYKITDTSFNVEITLKDVSNKTKVSLMDNTVPFSYCNPLTMADIDFDVDVDNRSEADLDAFATIIFHDSLGRGMAGVITKTERLVVRKKCEDTLCKYSPIPPPVPNCIFWGLCCWWWIVILIAVIVLFWFILRRRRNRQAYDQT